MATLLVVFGIGDHQGGRVAKPQWALLLDKKPFPLVGFFGSFLFHQRNEHIPRAEQIKSKDKPERLKKAGDLRGTRDDECIVPYGFQSVREITGDRKGLPCGVLFCLFSQNGRFMEIGTISRPLRWGFA